MWKLTRHHGRVRAPRCAYINSLQTARRPERLEPRECLAGYVQTNLVADLPGAALLQDPKLISPWGLVDGGGGSFVVANNGTSTATVYSGLVAGSAFAAAAAGTSIAGGFPTAAVLNTTGDFRFINPSTGLNESPAYIFAVHAGGAAGTDGGDFTGLAIGASGGLNYLYNADFQNGKIDVFDGDYKPAALPGAFTDAGLPAGYAPFNIQLIGGQLYVTYALRQNAGEDGGGGTPSFFTPRSGGGVIDVYNTDGTFVKRFSSDSHLNAPWGLVLAPASFGGFANDLLVANFGDGRISAFDPASGTFLGQLADPSNDPISISGLRGLVFGNGITAGDPGSLFFTAEPGAASNPPESVAVTLLDPSGQGALTAVGNGTVNVAGGGEIAIHSNNASAAVAIGNGHVSAPEIDVAGKPGALTLGGGSISGTIDVGASLGADPLASLPAPALMSPTFSAVYAAGSANITLQPGVYAGGIHVSGGATVTLAPGIYDLQGGGLSVTGQGQLSGNGVFIYDAPQSSADGISITGSGSLSLTAIMSGVYRGIALFESRDANVPIAVSGNGLVNLTGAVYAPDAAVQVYGNGRLTMRSDSPNGIAAQLVAGELNVYNNGAFNLASIPVAASNSGERGLFGMLQAADAAPLKATSVKFATVEGQPFSGAVAAFTSSLAAAAAGDFTATIDWGDGTTTAGNVASSGAGGFLVSGMHAYAEEGNQSVNVVIHDNSGNAVTAQDAVAVTESPLFGTGTHFVASPGQPQRGIVIGSFVDTGGAEPIGNYSATIDWGDGTSSAGTITALGGGAFNVSGDHLYAHSGRFAVIATVKDEGGAKTTIRSLAGGGSADADGVFVAQAFQDILGRSPDPTGAAHFAGLLKQGLARISFTQQLTHADEYYAHRIEQAYEDYLGRGADATGLNFWLRQMRSGLTDEQLEAAFIGSAEFYNHAGGSNRAWVDEMYFDLLGRAPDAAGEAYWVNALAQGFSRSLAATGFAASAERESATVRNDYLTFLGRQPGPSEVAAWVNEFRAGLVNEQIVAGFVASDEYFREQTADA